MVLTHGHEPNLQVKTIPDVHFLFSGVAEGRGQILRSDVYGTKQAGAQRLQIWVGGSGQLVFSGAKAAYITGELLSLSHLTATLQLTDNHSEYTLGAHTVNHVKYFTCHSFIPKGL